MSEANAEEPGEAGSAKAAEEGSTASAPKADGEEPSEAPAEAEAKEPHAAGSHVHIAEPEAVSEGAGSAGVSQVAAAAAAGDEAQQPVEEKGSKEGGVPQKGSKESAQKQPVPEGSKEQLPEKTASKSSLRKKSSIRIIAESSVHEISAAKERTSGASRKSRLSSIAGFEPRDAQRKSITSTARSKGVLGSVISVRRISVDGDQFQRGKVARYMNTYKLEPDNPFNPEKVEHILENIMTEAMDNLTYDPDKCPKQAKWASGAIRAKVKELEFDRYKLVCLVTIGEKNSQDVLVSCRFLWDSDRDRYATYTLENTHVYGIAQCFGLYYE